MTPAQIESNLGALAAAGGVDLDRLVGLAMDPETYWGERAALAWT